MQVIITRAEISASVATAKVAAHMLGDLSVAKKMKLGMLSYDTLAAMIGKEHEIQRAGKRVGRVSVAADSSIIFDFEEEVVVRQTRTLEKLLYIWEPVVAAIKPMASAAAVLLRALNPLVLKARDQTTMLIFEEGGSDNFVAKDQDGKIVELTMLRDIRVISNSCTRYCAFKRVSPCLLAFFAVKEVDGEYFVVGEHLVKATREDGFCAEEVFKHFGEVIAVKK